MDPIFSLVILAAGLGSRFGGGIKQLEPVGPCGEIIMDYSVHDAMEAGFNQVVFIIRRDIEDAFRQVIGNRIEQICRARGVRVAYAYQEVADLPAGFSCPSGRTKPWGTGHALLACTGLLSGPFAVINADDYYGKDAFRRLYGFLAALPSDSTGEACMAGFRLSNTLSERGGVTRGLCEVGPDGSLLQIKETRNVVKTPTGAGVQTDRGIRPVPTDTSVSMNFWGFTPHILELLQGKFRTFLEQKGHQSDSEFLIPVTIDELLAEGCVRVSVLPTEDHWFGVTYRGDLPTVRESFRALHASGFYNTPLFP